MAAPIVTTRILRRFLSSGVHSRAERLLQRVHPADLGPLLADLAPDEIRTVIDLLFKNRRAVTLLKELPPEMLHQVFDALTDERLAQVFARVEIDDMVEFVDQIPEERRDAVRALLPLDVRDELRHAELYPESSAGRAMTTSYIALDDTMRSVVVPTCSIAVSVRAGAGGCEASATARTIAIPATPDATAVCVFMCP